MKTNNLKPEVKKTVFNKSEIFKRAHYKFKQIPLNERNEKSFSDCLKTAWNIAKSNENLNFDEIYKQYYKEVLNFINYKVHNLENAKDIASKVFTKVNKILFVFDCSKAKFKTWLYKVANTAIIDFFRAENKKRAETTYISDYVNDNGEEYFQISDNSINSDNIENEQTNNKVKIALSKLKPQYRQIAELYFIQELTYNEIVETMQLSLSNVKVMIFRVREMLQSELKQQYELIKG